MHQKNIVYFVARSDNVPKILQEAIQRARAQQQVSIFFDLDGTRALDERYAQQVFRDENVDVIELYRYVSKLGVRLYACQMNVMKYCDLRCVDGIQSAGVVTFLEYAYQADAVFSY